MIFVTSEPNTINRFKDDKVENKIIYIWNIILFYPLGFLFLFRPSSCITLASFYLVDMTSRNMLSNLDWSYLFLVLSPKTILRCRFPTAFAFFIEFISVFS